MPALTAVVGAAYVENLGAADGRTRLRVGADTATMLARQLAGWADVVEVEGPGAVTAELARFGGMLVRDYRA